MGEALFAATLPGIEEIALTNEAATKTRHPKIWVGSVQSTEPGILEEAFADLAERADSDSHDEVLEALRRLVPEYGSKRPNLFLVEREAYAPPATTRLGR